MSWIKKHKESLKSWVIGACMIGIAVFGWYTIQMYQQKKATEEMIAANQLIEKKQEETLKASDSQNDFPDFSQDVIMWQGKTYRKNTYIKTILCMGVDRADDMIGTRDVGFAGQSDGIFLLAEDTARNQVKILMIPRDTMTEIMITDDNNEEIGEEVNHLTLAYAYGDGGEKSCNYMKTAVSKLLGGLPIDRYMAVDTKVIATLNDAVGGVTVTIPTDGMEKSNPEFVKGAKVTLHGSNAEKFIRYRDITRDGSALFRMDQHEEYIEQFFQAVKHKSKEDSQIVSKMFDMIQDYMITDMQKAEYLKIALDVLESGDLNSDSFETIPGIGVATDTYDEYYVDKTQIPTLLIKLFYRES